jgi:beta-glucanase (GH16 family)
VRVHAALFTLLISTPGQGEVPRPDRLDAVMRGDDVRPPAPQWQVDFIDNFDGSALDTSKWNVIAGADGESNLELQWYVDEQGKDDNYSVAKGQLTIRLQSERRSFERSNGMWVTKNFTSARLNTKDKAEFANGAWETRLQFWSGNGAEGVSAGFTLLGAESDEAPYPGPTCWPMRGAREINLFGFTTNTAQLRNQGAVITNLIEGDACQQGRGRRDDVPVSASAWHTYRLEYSGGEVKIFIDGKPRRALNDDPWQDQPMFAVLHVAIGGTFGGAAAWPSGARAGVNVDYVKHESLQ